MNEQVSIQRVVWTRGTNHSKTNEAETIKQAEIDKLAETTEQVKIDNRVETNERVTVG